MEIKINKKQIAGNTFATVTLPLKTNDAIEREIVRFGIEPFTVKAQSYMAGFRRWENLVIEVADINNPYNDLDQIEKNKQFIAAIS